MHRSNGLAINHGANTMRLFLFTLVAVIGFSASVRAQGVSHGLTTPGALSPAAGTAYKIVTGGTAVTLVTGPVNGCQIVNPLSAADEGIATAEVAYLNPVTTATTTGNNTTVTLQPGQAWNAPGALASGVNISVNAATSSHAFTVIVW